MVISIVVFMKTFIYLFIVQMILVERTLIFVKLYANKPIQIKMKGILVFMLLSYMFLYKVKNFL